MYPGTSFHPWQDLPLFFPTKICYRDEKTRPQLAQFPSSMYSALLTRVSPIPGDIHPFCIPGSLSIHFWGLVFHRIWRDKERDLFFSPDITFPQNLAFNPYVFVCVPGLPFHNHRFVEMEFSN